MKTLRFRCFAQHAGMNKFLHDGDLLPETSAIGSFEVLQFKIDREVIDQDYIDRLIAHIESMAIGKFRYTNVKLLSIG